jgi:hypothetical protein
LGTGHCNGLPVGLFTDRSTPRKAMRGHPGCTWARPGSTACSPQPQLEFFFPYHEKISCVVSAAPFAPASSLVRARTGQSARGGHTVLKQPLGKRSRHEQQQHALRGAWWQRDAWRRWALGQTAPPVPERPNERYVLIIYSPTGTAAFRASSLIKLCGWQSKTMSFCWSRRGWEICSSTRKQSGRKHSCIM